MLIVSSTILTLLVISINYISPVNLNIEIGKLTSSTLGGLIVPLIVVAIFQIGKKNRNNRSRVKIFLCTTIIIFMVKFTPLLQTLDVAAQDVDSNISLTGDKLISADGFIGCKEIDYLKKLINHVKDENLDLFITDLNLALSEETCIKFTEKEAVKLVSEKDDLLEVTRNTDGMTYWMEKDAVER